MSARRIFLALVIALGGVAMTGSAQAAPSNSQAALPGWFINHPELAHLRGLTDYYPGAEQYLNQFSEQQRIAAPAYPAWLTDHPELAHLTGLTDYYPGAAAYLEQLAEQQSATAANTAASMARTAPEWFRNNPELAHLKGLADYYPGA